MNGSGSGGAKRNYFSTIQRRRVRVVHVTPAQAFFRRIGNFLDREMGRFVTIAAASVAVTFIAGIAALYITVLPDRRGIERIGVPDFTGMIYREGAANADLFDVTLEYKYDSSKPAGTVISQYPAAGSMRLIKSGERRCELTLTLSRGTKTILVPDCVGIGSAQAELQLRTLGFEVTVNRQYSHTVKSGYVISSSPSAFTDLAAGSRVTLNVSLGKKLDTVVVPALTGLGEAAAMTKLLAVGLLAGQTEYVKSPSPAGTVIAQSMPFGSEVREGSRVSLTVSLGP